MFTADPFSVKIDTHR